MPKDNDSWKPNDNDCFCARCLTEADRRAPQCSRCDTPFTGSGRFDLVSGIPPSSIFLESLGSYGTGPVL